MKKIISVLLTLLISLSCSVSVFAAEESVPYVGSGEWFPSENTAELTNEERQLRETAYQEILALSKTDENILAVQLSKDSRWVFWEVAGTPETIKDYAKRFEKYSEFLIFTDDVEKSMENFEEIPYADGSILWDATPQPKRAGYGFWIIGICVFLVLGTGYMLFRSKRLIPALITADGKLIAGNAKISTKEIVLSVKRNETAPDRRVMEAILRQIDSIK